MLQQLLFQYEFFTCKPQIEPLSPEELLLTWKKLAILGLGQTIPKGRLVFRRERKRNLYSQLNCDCEELLFSRLFYFGEKAKYYHEKFLQKKEFSYGISDCSSNVARNIFAQISAELLAEHSRVIDFVKREEAFSNFFLKKQNKVHFVKMLTGNIQFRDYYLTFLHTLGHRSNAPTHFISTSTRLQLTIKDKPADLIILYALPSQYNGFAVRAHSQRGIKKVDTIEDRLKKNALPVCQRWVYDEQLEISAKSGLFPQLIWGVFDLARERLILNPHMFRQNQRLPDLFLRIDQSDFEKRLADTNYHMGTLLLNGKFSNIFP